MATDPSPPLSPSLMFFEQAREHAEQEYGKNKRDTQVRERARSEGGARRGRINFRAAVSPGLGKKLAPLPCSRGAARIACLQ